MNQAPRGNDEWYRDVTQDAHADREADHVPELRSVFVEVGFRRVGFLGKYGPEGNLGVTEVLSSPGQDTFLILSLSPAAMLRPEPRTIPTATLESALSDGSIIITTTCAGRLWNLNHPKAGLCLQEAIDGGPADAWRSHQALLEDFTRERGCAPLRHESMHLCLWVAERCRKVGTFVAVVALWSGVVAFVLALGSLLKLLDSVRAQAQAGAGAFWVPVSLAVSAVIFSAAMWISWRRGVRAWHIGQWLARQFAYPRRRPYEPAISNGPTQFGFGTEQNPVR